MAAAVRLNQNQTLYLDLFQMPECNKNFLVFVGATLPLNMTVRHSSKPLATSESYFAKQEIHPTFRLEIPSTNQLSAARFTYIVKLKYICPW